MDLVNQKGAGRPIVSRPAGCSSFDSAASSHQQCSKRDSHRAALVGCSCKGNFQAVLVSSSVSSWVGSALPDLILHIGQLYLRTLTSPFGRHRHGVCAWMADVDNWTSGICHLLSVCMEQSLGWSCDPGRSLLTFRRQLKTYLFNPPGYLSS